MQKLEKPTSKKLAIPLIRIDGGTQPREEINIELVAEYAQAMQDGAVFPPVDVFHDGKHYWLADGFHRYHATAKAGESHIKCNVHNGTKRDAVLFSVGANATHGLKRTNADKRRSVMTLLEDAEWGSNSDNWIAKIAKVSAPTIKRIRDDFNILKSSVRSTSSGRTIDTTNIGRKPAAVSAPKLTTDEDEWEEVTQDKPTDKDVKGSGSLPRYQPAKSLKVYVPIKRGDVDQAAGALMHELDHKFLLQLTDKLAQLLHKEAANAS